MDVHINKILLLRSKHFLRTIFVVRLQHGNAALHYVITHCPLVKTDIAALLTDAGADINLANHVGPIRTASIHNYFGLIFFDLVRRGRNTPPIPILVDIYHILFLSNLSSYRLSGDVIYAFVVRLFKLNKTPILKRDS